MSVLRPAVLAIEDDLWTGEIHQHALKNHYEVTLVDNLNDAIEAVESIMPSVIIADILLAGETIFTLLNELQTSVDLAKIPVIIISNMTDRLPVKSLKSYGIVDILPKSKITPEDIRAAVRRAI